MSFYNYSVEENFKKTFNCSYLSLNDDQVLSLLSKVLLSSLSKPNLKEKKLIDSIARKILINDSGFRSMLKDSENGRAKIVLDFHNVLNNFNKLSNEKIKSAAYFIYRSYTYDKIIKIYAKKEKLDIKLVEISKGRDCLTILTQLFARNFLKVILSEVDYLEISNLISNLHINEDLDSAYNRTTSFQKFLHQLTEKYKNKNTINKIPSELMRGILSTCRLHLSYHDELNYKLIDLMKVYSKTNNDFHYALENMNNSFFIEKKDLQHLANKKYIKNWNLRHLSPIFTIDNNWFDSSDEVIDFLINTPNDDRYLLLKSCLIASENMSIKEINSINFKDCYTSSFFGWLSND